MYIFRPGCKVTYRGDVAILTSTGIKVKLRHCHDTCILTYRTGFRHGLHGPGSPQIWGPIKMKKLKIINRQLIIRYSVWCYVIMAIIFLFIILLIREARQL